MACTYLDGLSTLGPWPFCSPPRMLPRLYNIGSACKAHCILDTSQAPHLDDSHVLDILCKIEKDKRNLFGRWLFTQGKTYPFFQRIHIAYCKNDPPPAKKVLNISAAQKQISSEIKIKFYERSTSTTNHLPQTAIFSQSSHLGGHAKQATQPLHHFRRKYRCRISGFSGFQSGSSHRGGRKQQ